MTPAEARSLFPITAERAYLFSGGLAPAAAPVRAAHDRWTEQWALDPGYVYAHYHDDWDRAKETFARLIGAEAGEVAVVDHTSRGSNLAIQMIEAGPGSNVVVDEFTYPSSLYPWRLPAKSHVEIRYVPARDHRVHLDDLARAVDERTVAVSVTHVCPKTGFRHDLAAVAELAHAHGAYLLVDAAQSAGVLQIDVRSMGIDFLSTCAMKWLLGTPGVGFLFVAREHVDRIAPPQVGYPGLVRPPVFDPQAELVFKPGAVRHELGISSLPGLAATQAGMEILLDLGIAQIEAHVLDLAGYCIEELRRRDLRLYTHPEPELRAGVIAMPVVGGDTIVEFLRARSVDVWTDGARTLLRIDPHLFNNRDDVDRFLAGMDAFARAHGWRAIQG
jgi:cysteine desulfurase / selenocysteine lyase